MAGVCGSGPSSAPWRAPAAHVVGRPTIVDHVGGISPRKPERDVRSRRITPAPQHDTKGMPSWTGRGPLEASRLYSKTVSSSSTGRAIALAIPPPPQRPPPAAVPIGRVQSPAPSPVLPARASPANRTHTHCPLADAAQKGAGHVVHHDTPPNAPSGVPLLWGERRHEECPLHGAGGGGSMGKELVVDEPEVLPSRPRAPTWLPSEASRDTPSRAHDQPAVSRN